MNTAHQQTNNNQTAGFPRTSPAHQRAGDKSKTGKAKSAVKKDIKQEVTDKIISLLESGTDTWQKTWISQAAGGFPVNAKTKANYNGVNILLLWAAQQENNFSTNQWMTFKQAEELGGNVRKGEKGTMGVFFGQFEPSDKDAVPTTPGEHHAEGEEIKMSLSFARSFYLFNLDQVDGLDHLKPLTPATTKVFLDNAEIEAFITKTNATIQHGFNGAFYAPDRDSIAMPNKEAFTSEANYYATLLHELSHWTGHKTRVNRDFSGRFGSNAYATEELCAEFCACTLMAKFGLVDAVIENHASYLASWLKVLKEDKNFIFTVAKQAFIAFDYLENLEAAH